MATVTLVGLDIGSTSIRAAETSRTKGGQVIRNFGQAPLPGGAVQGGVVQDDKAVTLGLKRLWNLVLVHSCFSPSVTALSSWTTPPCTAPPGSGA